MPPLGSVSVTSSADVKRWFHLDPLSSSRHDAEASSCNAGNGVVLSKERAGSGLDVNKFVMGLQAARSQ